MQTKQRSKAGKARIWFIRACLLFFYTIFVAASVRNVIETGGDSYFGPFASMIDVLSDIPSIIKNEILEKNPRMIEDVVTKHHFDFKIQEQNTKGKLLVPSFDFKKNTPVCDLYNLNTGNSLKQWALPKDEVKSTLPFLPKNHNPYLGHPYMLQDSSIISYTIDGLIKLDKNNKILWKNNLLGFHHSIELDSKGNIWICMTAKNNNFYPPLWVDKIESYSDDGIASIDPETGRILFQKSITKMLFENNYHYLVEGIGKVESDQIHVNDIQPAMKKTEFWNEGDVFISIRNRSTIILYRPSTDKIIWLKTGPWINQHDVDIIDDSKISIFGNDAAMVAMKIYDNIFTSSTHNNIYIFDFNTNNISLPYRKIMAKENIATPAQGSCEILTNGTVIIDETEKGKVYLLDTSQIRFTFSERIDENHIYMLPWVRYIEN